MKKIKIYLLSFCSFLLSSMITFANDWEFGSQGEHLIPLTQSDVTIKKEIISLKLTDKGMQVHVNFTFDSPTSDKKIIGFVTPESDEVSDYSDTYEANPNVHVKDFKIKNFQTKVNGNIVKSHVDLLRNIWQKPILDKQIALEYRNDKDNKFINNYIYFFEANFQKGINTIEHSYLYSGSEGISERDFSYVITTISKWKNKRVEDFEVNIDMGNYYCSVPYSFWNNNKRVNWDIIGEGRIFYSDKNVNTEARATLLKMKYGHIRYRAKNFSPDKDIYISIPLAPHFAFSAPEGLVEGYRFRDPLSTSYSIDDLRNASNFELDVLRNYPYAFAGYEFSRKDLRDYFSQFFWYIPTGKNIKLDLYQHDPELLETIDKLKMHRGRQEEKQNHEI